MRSIFLCPTLLLSSSALAGGPSLDLAHYRLTAMYNLPLPAAAEASAVTFNWDTATLLVLGDEGDALVEVTTTGQTVSQLTLTGFEDTEGITYIGNGHFVLVEERLQDVYLLHYMPNTTIDRSTLSSVSLGLTVGNIGLEGISFDPLTGKYISVKEKTPQGVFEDTIDWGVPSASVIDLFIPNLGVLDLSDVQVLTTVPSLIATPDQDNLLIYSQESAKLMEVTRAGSLASSFDFTGIAVDAEGLTIGPDGTIYIVGEAPTLYVLTRASVDCPADVSPSGNPDGTVDVNDLLSVITSWGACANCPPVHCPADIAPIVNGTSVGDCTVDVNDLLAVITSWGACR